MRRTAKRALHAQLVCQRCATQSRSFQSDLVICMQLAMGRTTHLMPMSRRCCPFVGACIHLHSLEDHGVLYASLLKSCICGLDLKHFGCSLRLPPCTAILTWYRDMYEVYKTRSYTIHGVREEKSGRFWEPKVLWLGEGSHKGFAMCMLHAIYPTVLGLYVHPALNIHIGRDGSIESIWKYICIILYQKTQLGIRLWYVMIYLYDE